MSPLLTAVLSLEKHGLIFMAKCYQFIDQKIHTTIAALFPEC